MNGVLQDLSRILGGACATDESSRLAKTLDSWPQAMGWPESDVRARLPLAVALPQTEARAAGILKWAARHSVAVVARGAGSGVVGAAIPCRSPSIVVDLSRIETRFILKEDADGPWVVTDAGILGSELESRLNQSGYSLCHFPASLAVSTPGGWIATRSFGQLSTRYGGIERQAAAVRAAYPSGEIATGPPRRHLGAEGTLGLITEVTLRIRRMPRAHYGAAVSFTMIEEALAFLRRLRQSDIPKPAVMRLYNPVDAMASLGSPGTSGRGPLKDWLEIFAMRRHRWLNALARIAARKWVAVLYYEDDPQSLQRVLTLPDIKPAQISAGPAENWWRRRYHWSLDRLRKVFENGSFADTLDVWGAWDIIPVLECKVAEAMRPYAFVMSHLSHFDDHGACLYVTFAGAGKNIEESRRRHSLAWKAGLDACVQAGGTTNHHHGVGLAKLPWIDRAVDPAWLKEIRRIKSEVDPSGILNPGKLCL